MIRFKIVKYLVYFCVNFFYLVMSTLEVSSDKGYHHKAETTTKSIQSFITYISAKKNYIYIHTPQ